MGYKLFEFYFNLEVCEAMFARIQAWGFFLMKHLYQKNTIVVWFPAPHQTETLKIKNHN